MQHFADLQNSSEFGDPDSSTNAVSSAPNSNLNRDLFNDLVEIVPLVESLMVTNSSKFRVKNDIFFTLLFLFVTLNASSECNKTCASLNL
jgi:hypothetical protein